MGHGAWARRMWREAGRRARTRGVKGSDHAGRGWYVATWHVAIARVMSSSFPRWQAVDGTGEGGVGADAWVLMQRTGRWHCLLGFEAAPRNTTARSSEVVRPAAHARRTTTPPCKSRALASGAAAQGNRGKRACSSWIEMNEFLWSPPWRRTADAPARALTCAALRRRRRRASDWATVEGEQRPRRKAPARAISSPSMAVAIRRDAHTRSTHHHLPTRAGRTVCALPNTSLPANTRQGKPGGRAAALRRDAAAARGVSGKQRAGDGHRAPEWGGPGAGCRCGRGRVQVWSGRDRSGESG